MTEPEVADELRALGRTLVVEPPADDLVVNVLARIAARPRRRKPRAWLAARRRRWVAVVIAAVIIGLGLTPPVRAAVVEWLRVGGVLVRTAPAPAGPSPTAQPVPTVGATLTLDEARALVDFPVGVPAALGSPDRISVSADRRVVAMDWGSGADQVHLDQFDGRLSWVFVKQAREPVRFVAVDGRDAVWFATAHEVTYVDADGQERTEQARIAGPCLIWERSVQGGAVTMRLEGELTQDRAVTIAESTRSG